MGCGEVHLQMERPGRIACREELERLVGHGFREVQRLFSLHPFVPDGRTVVRSSPVSVGVTVFAPRGAFLGVANMPFARQCALVSGPLQHLRC